MIREPHALGDALGERLAVGEGLGEGDALDDGEAAGVGDGVAIGSPTTNVPVPPSAVVSVNVSSAIDQVVTVGRAFANRLPYEPSGQNTSVLGPGVIVIPSDPVSTYDPERVLQSARAAKVPSAANSIA